MNRPAVVLAHDFGNGGGADAVTEIAVYDNAGTAALGRNFLEKQKNKDLVDETPIEKSYDL